MTGNIVPQHSPALRPFTRSTEYAIRSLTYLAQNQKEGSYHLAREMSEVLGIPAPFLGKILQPLVMRGILESQRGRNGGFRLSRDPKDVCLYQIADSQEMIYEKRQCFLGQAACDDSRACPKHEYWKAASAEFELQMNETSLQDLIHFCSESTSSEYPMPESFGDGSVPPPGMGPLRPDENLI